MQTSPTTESSAPSLLASWRDLNAPGALNMLSEHEVHELLEYEKRTQGRYDMLVRLHQRYSTLRVARERKELMKFVK